MMFEIRGVAKELPQAIFFESKYRYKDSRIHRFFNFNAFFYCRRTSANSCFLLI